MFGKEGLTPEECRRRLKNWFIIGNDPEVALWKSNPWTVGRYRLCELASDNTHLPTYGKSDAQLDKACRGMFRDEWIAEGGDMDIGSDED